MRRRTLRWLASASLALLAALAAVSCLTDWSAERGRAVIGVLETRQNLERSRVVLYDEGLRVAGEVRLDYATLGNDWNLSPVHGGTLFVVPEGLMGRLDERKVLGVDLETLEVEALAVERTHLYGPCADDDYVYVCSNLDGTSRVSRIDRLTREVIEVSLEGVYVQSLCLAGGGLVAFASETGSPSQGGCRSWVYEYDRDLELVSATDISGLGSGQYRPEAMGDKVLFASWSGPDGDAPSTSLGVYRVGAGTLESVEMGASVLDALPCRQGVLVLFGDIHGGGTTRATVYDPETWTPLGGTFDLGCEVAQRVVSGDTLYVVGSGRELLSFDLSDGIAPVASSRVDEMDGSFSYVSGMFEVP